MNKIYKRLAVLLCITGSVLSQGTVFGATNFGTMNLTLNGEVDLAKTPNPATAHYLEGTLTGTTSMTLTTAYNTKNDTWLSIFTLTGLSGNNSSCSGGRNIFGVIPGTNKKGLELVNSTNPAVKAYVIPALQYTTIIGKDHSEGWTMSGLFFSPPTGSGAASSDNSYTCFYPSGKSVPSTWHKQMMIYDKVQYPIYFSRPVASGALRYTGAPLYITTEGAVGAARGYLKVNVSTNVNIMSTCQISNVTNNNIDVNMSLTNEVITESSLTFNCTGDGQYPVYLSARVTEGTADSTNPTRLLLKNTASPLVTKRPWVMGKTFLNGISPALTCQDTNSDGLIKFNGQETALPLKATSDQLYHLGIKWAICSDDTVPAGNYRGKTVISIYTRM
ncbi:hypothetical protein [Morganella psychrotolerans]|uniref:hypothetical protein n=1 Tax=Morganella psychrotolerans TaxID=368603 RepID=UPI0039AFDBEC